MNNYIKSLLVNSKATFKAILKANGKVSWLTNYLGLASSFALVAPSVITPSYAATNNHVATYIFDAKSRSTSELRLIYKQLLDENPTFVGLVKQFLIEYQDFTATHKPTVYNSLRFAQQIAVFYSNLNARYKLEGYNYLADPQVDAFAQLGDTCLALADKNDKLVEADDSCSFILALYLVAGYQRDGVQSLAMLGKATELASKKQSYALTTSEQEALDKLNNWKELNLNFSVFLPNYKYFAAQGIDKIRKLYGVTIIPSEEIDGSK